MKKNILKLQKIKNQSIFKFVIILILLILISIIALPQFLYADSNLGVNSSNSMVSNFITRFYITCLNRMPDSEGLQSWTNGLITGRITGADVANGFIFSDELMSKNLSDEDFLTILYKAFFNRQPDTAGYNSWLNLLRNGASRHYVLAGFINSIEFDALCDSYGINPGTLSSDSYSSRSDSSNASLNSTSEVFSIENNLLSIINQARAKNGARQLVINAALSNIARARSIDMLTRNYFSHITPDGKNIFMILNENGYSWQLAGENIFECSPAANGTESAIFNIWMSSPSHRDNIFNGNFSQAGIGIIDISGIRAATMVFSN